MRQWISDPYKQPPKRGCLEPVPTPLQLMSPFDFNVFFQMGAALSALICISLPNVFPQTIQQSGSHAHTLSATRRYHNLKVLRNLAKCEVTDCWLWGRIQEPGAPDRTFHKNCWIHDLFPVSVWKEPIENISKGEALELEGDWTNWSGHQCEGVLLGMLELDLLCWITLS